MNVKTLFGDTSFSTAGDGNLVAQPSLWMQAGRLSGRAAVAALATILYVWVYPIHHPSPTFLLIPLSAIFLSIANTIILTLCIEYRIEDDKLVFKRGFLRRRTGAVNMGRIQNTTMTQSFFEQMVGIGTIVVNTDDSVVGVLWLRGMKRPDALRGALLAASEIARKERGLYEFARP